MNKLLVILLTAMLVFSISTASSAAINWSGELETGYIFVNEFDDDLADDFAKDGVGYNKLTLKIDGKVSDSVTAYAKIEGYDGDLQVDESYFVVNTSIGKFSFGDWDQKLSGVNGVGELEVLDINFMPIFITGDELWWNHAFMVKWDAAGVPDGMILDLGYIRENAMAWATLGYAAENWGVNYNYLRWDDLSSYTANAYFKPIDNITIYAHFFDIEDIDIFDAAIIGVYGEYGKFFAYYEYDTDEKANGIFKGNTFGYKLGYNFTNKVTAYYESSSIYGELFNQGLYLKVKFK